MKFLYFAHSTPWSGFSKSGAKTTIMGSQPDIISGVFYLKQYASTIEGCFFSFINVYATTF